MKGAGNEDKTICQRNLRRCFLSRAIDLTGQKFGRLAVIQRHGSSKDGKATWFCRCDCGNEAVVMGKLLRNGATRSCGCLKKEMDSAYKLDLTGSKYGKLTVVERAGKDDKKDSLWLCKCDCGNTKIVKQNYLMGGHTRSCGCLRKDAAKIQKHYSGKYERHGMSKTRIYHIYYTIKSRCLVKSNKAYKDYGAKGIGLCKEWEDSFLAFALWSFANGYAENLTLDRIDNSKGYSLSNCRWTTAKQQANNTTSNINITINGEQRTLAEWCDYYGLNYFTIYSRKKKHGWEEENLFSGNKKLSKKEVA